MVEGVQYLCIGRQLQCGLLDGQEHASQLEWRATFSTFASCQQVVMPSHAPPLCPCKHILGCPCGVQGLPEGHTEACYPIMRPGLDGHRAPPLRDSDSERREVSGLLCWAPTAARLTGVAIDALG